MIALPSRQVDRPLLPTPITSARAMTPVDDSLRAFVPPNLPLPLGSSFARALRDEFLRRGLDVPGWIEADFLAFAGYVHERMPPYVDASAALKQVRVPGLALVFGCLAGDSRALRTFDREIMSRLGESAGDRSYLEIRPELFARLFVPIESPVPRAVSYRGRGRLLPWVRSVAANMLRNAQRAYTPVWGTEREYLRAPDAADNPEAACLGAECLREVDAAMQKATAALSDRDRELLCARFIEELTLQEIATRLDIHRETATFWLERARHRLDRAVRKELATRFGKFGDDGSLIEEAISRGLSGLEYVEPAE